MRPCQVLAVTLCLVAVDVLGEPMKAKTAHSSMSGQLPGQGNQPGEGRDVTVNVEGHRSLTVKAVKKQTGNGAPYNAPPGTSYSSGESSRGSLACFEECNAVGQHCQHSCFVNTEDDNGKKASCYHSSKQQNAVCFYEPENKNFGLDYVVPPEPRLHRRADSMDRVRRSATNLSNLGFAKIAFSPDGATMNIFRNFTNGNITAAETEFSMYLLLITNEMTDVYQSMANRSYTVTVGEVKRDLDIAVRLVHIAFPPNNGTHFLEPEWAVVNSTTGQLIDPLGKFRNCIRYQPFPVVYDFAIAIVGHTLSGTLGLAYVGTVCRTDYTKYDYNIGWVGAYAGLDRIMSHELGHGFNMSHDSNELCPSSINVMSPWLPSSTQPYYDVFSNCSAVAMSVYLSTIYEVGNFHDTCLYDEQSVLTYSSFLMKFCEGSYQSLSLLEQCKIRFGVDSTLCATSLNETFVSSCANGIECTVPAKDSCSRVNEVNDGTPCVPEGGMPNYHCYEAKCQPLQTWCDETTTTPTTTTPTTTTPTTTTSTSTSTTTTTITTTTTTTTPPPTTTPTTTMTTTTTKAPPPACVSAPCSSATNCDAKMEADCVSCCCCKWNKGTSSCVFHNKMNLINC